MTALPPGTPVQQKTYCTWLDPAIYGKDGKLAIQLAVIPDVMKRRQPWPLNESKIEIEVLVIKKTGTKIAYSSGTHSTCSLGCWYTTAKEFRAATMCHSLHRICCPCCACSLLLKHSHFSARVM